ncbi:MBL fold metallo-hydrolase [Xanthobacter sp. AM11]|uniref:MBL fold metallo-hydrolase n=1 Tax=Xanthobacter sp. AM11 TaxID=3380643 RepID=UPI0039BFE70D
MPAPLRPRLALLPVLLLALAAWCGPFAPAAAGAVPPEKCPRMVAQRPPVRLAALDPGWARHAEAAADRMVRLTFVGHASFLIESPEGVTIVTDYNDYVRPNLVPQVATMNHAHDTHYTDHPDPEVEHVLRGWNPDGGPARHELTLQDVWIRNVPTNIRRGSATEYGGNSIFVFEVAGLCIAHLGHLHHLLTPDHLEALGRIDVVLAPVDGSYTLDLEGMVETLKAINAPLVIPMHYFSAWGLERFLPRLGKEYEVRRSDGPVVVLSRETLPKAPTLLVLPGR